MAVREGYFKTNGKKTQHISEQISTSNGTSKYTRNTEIFVYFNCLFIKWVFPIEMRFVVTMQTLFICGFLLFSFPAYLLICRTFMGKEKRIKYAHRVRTKHRVQ